MSVVLRGRLRQKLCDKAVLTVLTVLAVLIALNLVPASSKKG